MDDIRLGYAPAARDDFCHDPEEWVCFCWPLGVPRRVRDHVHAMCAAEMACRRVPPVTVVRECMTPADDVAVWNGDLLALARRIEDSMAGTVSQYNAYLASAARCAR